MRARSRFISTFRFRNVRWRTFKTPKGHYLYVPQHTYVPLYNRTPLTRPEMAKALDTLPQTEMQVINQRAREGKL